MNKLINEQTSWSSKIWNLDPQLYAENLQYAKDMLRHKDASESLPQGTSQLVGDTQIYFQEKAFNAQKEAFPRCSGAAEKNLEYHRVQENSGVNDAQEEDKQKWTGKKWCCGVMGQHKQGPRNRADRGVWARNLQTVCQCPGTKYKIWSFDEVSAELVRG